MSVDATYLPIQEPEEFYTQWYSLQMNSSDIMYEFGGSIGPIDIFWVPGPYLYSRFPDNRNFWEGLKWKLGVQEKLTSEDVYSDEKILLQSD